MTTKGVQNVRKTNKKSDKPILTVRQRFFVDSYLKDGNATKAAIAAGYSETSARVQGVRLLRNDNVSAEIDRVIKKAAEKTLTTAESVLSSLRNVAERCMQAVPVMKKVDGEWVETGEFRFDAAGANRALELLGKHLKLWNDVGSKGNPLHALDDLTDEQLDQRLAVLMTRGLE